MKYSVNATVAFAALSALTLGMNSDALAGTGACNLNIQLTKAAEMMPGGAHAKDGAGMKKDKMAGMKMDKMPGMKMDKMPSMKKGKMPGMKHDAIVTSSVAKDEMAGMKMDKMAGMKGAHEVHEGQYGGTFFMAPNKTHHVEGIHSKECGFRLVIFNAMTQPINVTRFAAFVKYIPEDEDVPEVYRILSPARDASVFEVASNPEIKGKYNVELYVKFPGSDEPVMFNIRTKH